MKVKKKRLILILCMIMLCSLSCYRVNAEGPKYPINKVSPLKERLKREDIMVKVDWMDQDLEKVNVTLYANKKVYRKATITEKDKWTHTFKKVPVKSHGKVIQYTIKQNSLKGYTTEIFGTAKKGFIISNVESSKLKEKTTIKINLEWSGKRKDQVKVKLKANKKVIKTITLNSKNNYMAYIKDMPLFDQKKRKINYAITEDSPSSYTTFIKMGAHYCYTITCVDNSAKNIDPLQHKEESKIKYGWPLIISAAIILIVLITTIAVQVHKDHKED